jgi:hypothetical protein
VIGVTFQVPGWCREVYSVGFIVEKRVGSFINVTIVVLEDLSSEIPIDVTHHSREHVNLFIEWIDAIAAGCCRHSKPRGRAVVVNSLVNSGSVFEAGSSGG